MDIILNDITKTYPDQTHAALSLPGRLEFLAEHTHGVLGHSGCGKSTLLNLISMLDLPDPVTPAAPDSGTGAWAAQAGTISYFPEGMHELGHIWPRDFANGEGAESWRLKHFSFVFQSGHLLKNFSVMDNILMPLTLGGLRQEDYDIATKHAEDLLTTLEIPKTHWKKLAVDLSGGEYQRVSVARALARNPSVVFADEPTGSLDPGLGETVMEALQTWRTKQDGRRLLIIITHNPKHVRKYCDLATVLAASPGQPGMVTLVSEVNDDTMEEIERKMSK